MHKKGRLLFLVILLTLSIFAVASCTELAVTNPPAGEDPVREAPPDDQPDDNDEQEERERLQAEHRQREESLRRQLGKFFVPLPPLEQEANPRVKARGIYLTGNTVGLERRFHELLDLIDATELNAVVIDVKNDHGVMSYSSNIEIVKEIGADKNVPIKDLGAVMAELKARDIYPIARIVVFKDPYLPEHHPEWAIQRQDGGGVWREKGVAWVNPYQKEVWDYNIAIAKEAALMGFKEIQFDYVRFPENASRLDREATYPGENGKAKDQAIEEFLQYAREQLEEYNVYLAADVFGVIVTSWGDSDRIGQTWERISPIVDYSCPMIYPSHYGPGYFGFSVPDAHPAGTITEALEDAIARNAPLDNPSIIRPWLQSFTATWVQGYIPYGPQQVREQIEAALALGIDEYLIWNPNNRYYAEAFLTDAEAKKLAAELQQERENKGVDLLNRTPESALEAFLTAARKKRWRETFSLHATGPELDYTNYKDWLTGWTGSLKSYEIISSRPEAGKTEFRVNLGIAVAGSDYQINDDRWEVYMANGIWRVKPSLNFTEMITYSPPEEPGEETT